MGISSDDIVQIAKEENVDPRMLLAMLGQENSRDTDVSNKGAMGRAQLLPATFKSVLPNGDINDPKDNVRAGARYLKEGLDKNGGDPAAAFSYYYAGPAWQKKIEAAPNKKYGGIGENDGISIEDYAKNAAKKLSNYGGAMSVEEFAANSFSIDFGTGDVSPKASNGPATSGSGSTIGDLSREADSSLRDLQTGNATLSDKIKASAAKQAATIRAGGELSATVALDKFQQENAKAGESAAELSRLGINLSDIDSVVAQTSVQMREDHIAADQMRASIMEKRAVGLLDSPLDYIINQFTLPQEIRQHNDIVRRIDANKTYLNDAASTARNLEQANAAKFTTVSLTGAKAGADLLRSQADLAAQQVEEKALATDYNRQVQQFTLLNARINNKRLEEESEDRSGMRRDKEQKVKDEAERVAIESEQIKTAAAVLGMKVPDRKELDKMPKDVKAAIEYIKANDGGIGKDPLEAWQVLARGNYREMPATVAYMRNNLDNAKRMAEELVMKDPVMQSASPAQRKEALSKQMTILLNQAQIDPNHSIKPNPGGGIDNPYHVPSTAVMEKIPGVMGTPLMKLIQVHQDQFKKQPEDSLVVELAYANIGKIYPDITAAAKDVSNYYREAVKYNNNTIHFDNFGMHDQENYKIKNMDLTRPDQVTKYYLDKKKREFMHPDFGMFSGPGVPMKSMEERIKAGEFKSSKE